MCRACCWQASTANQSELLPRLAAVCSRALTVLLHSAAAAATRLHLCQRRYNNRVKRCSSCMLAFSTASMSSSPGLAQSETVAPPTRCSCSSKAQTQNHLQAVPSSRWPTGCSSCPPALTTALMGSPPLAWAGRHVLHLQLTSQVQPQLLIAYTTLPAGPCPHRNA